MQWAVAIHGGAGLVDRNSLTEAREQACREGLDRALAIGERLLEQGADATEVVVAVVTALEEDPLFNAGRGAVLASGGHAELDASVMRGSDRNAGAVTGITTVRNPVQLARLVMERTPHVFLIGEGAEALAAEHQLERMPPEWFVVPERRRQYEQVHAADRFELDHGGVDLDVYGTVGAVALDRSGSLAAASSTGGMVNKRPGRVGDTPVIGAGLYAWDKTAAIAATGHGEPFITHHVASRVSDRMELLGETLEQAARTVIHDELPARAGGLIAVDRQGNLTLPFSSAGMFRAWSGQAGREVAIW